jgi:hypothetical protein
MCAMPSSGSLSILGTPQGVCSSISQVVEGNVTPPKSLATLGIDSGIGLPIKMSLFYSYTPTVINLVEGCTTGNGGLTACAHLCFLDFHSLKAGSCYCLCVCGYLSTTGQGASSSAYLCLTCNGTCIYGCTAAANVCIAALSTSFCVKSGDNVFMNIYAATTSCACTANAWACGYIKCITPIVGSASIGSPLGCQICTG